MSFKSSGPWFGAARSWLVVVAVIAVPKLRWARWRWDIDDEGIDIQHGTLAIRRTLVPWVRVQHVDTRRGLFEQAFGLSTVVVHTAAGSHTIPLLPRRRPTSCAPGSRVSRAPRRKRTLSGRQPEPEA